VPSASKPINNKTIGGVTLGHESFYTYLRLRLPLEAGMVVVSHSILFTPNIVLLIIVFFCLFDVDG
jgi:Xaa-Pro dipeptidase